MSHNNPFYSETFDRPGWYWYDEDFTLSGPYDDFKTAHARLADYFRRVHGVEEE